MRSDPMKPGLARFPNHQLVVHVSIEAWYVHATYRLSLHSFRSTGMRHRAFSDGQFICKADSISEILLNSDH